MPFKKKLYKCILILSLSCGCIWQAQVLNAQAPVNLQPQGAFKIIDIQRADRLGKENEYQYASGNVIMRQEKTYFYADSVSLNTITGLMEAFGRVHINDADSVHTYSDYLRYRGKERTAFLKGNVKLTDGTGTLTTDQLDYDMNTHIGIYRTGGKLLSGKSVLTSREGTYYGDTRDITFAKNVLLVDPQYRITTDSLLYNTSSRIATFTVPTTIESGDNRKIVTSDGTYNMDTRQAYFGSRPTIVDSTTTLIADEVAYDDRNGFGEARGNAILKDTAQGMVVIANNIKTNKQESSFLATINPLAIIQQEGDSTYIVADTLYSGKLSNRVEEYSKSFNDATQQSVVVDSLDYNIQDNVDAEVSEHLNENVLPGKNPIYIKRPATPALPVKDTVPDLGTLLGEQKDTSREETNHNHRVRDESIRDEIDHDHADHDHADHDHSRHVRQETVKNSEEATISDSITAIDKGKATPSAIDLNRINDNDSTKGKEIKAIDFSMPTAALASDTDSAADDKKDRFIEAYYNVRIFNDSLQAVCDSMFYSSQDSIFRLLKDPIAWTQSGNQYTQITGDTIFVYTENRKPKKIDVWKNAMMLGQPYIGQEHMLNNYYNQVMGNYIFAYLTNGALDSMQARYNAESVYYILDDGSKYLGVNNQKSEVLDFYFMDKKLDRIVGRMDIEGTFSPMGQVDHNSLRLSRYHLYDDRRPKTKFDLLAPVIDAGEEAEAPEVEKAETATPNTEEKAQPAE